MSARNAVLLYPVDPSYKPLPLAPAAPPGAVPGSGISAPAVFTVGTPLPAAPAVTGFTPSSGPAGMLVTVVGTNLTNATGVSFHGTAATTFSVVNATTISATVPTGATTGTVAVTTPGGTAASPVAFTVTASNPVPTVSSLAPTTTRAAAAAFTLTVNGTGFVTGSVVSFNGAALATTVGSATQLTAAVPASAVATAGSYNVTVTNPAPGGGASAASTFTVTTPPPTLPTIASFSPASGLAGTVVTLTGTNFTGATGVSINGMAATTFNVTNPTTISVTVPAAATTGPIVVTTPTGSAPSATSFSVTNRYPAPTITTLGPASAVNGSSQFVLTVMGTGFVSGSTVSFNGIALPTAFGSATQLTATVPASAVAAAGSYNVTVTNPVSGTLPTAVQTQLELLRDARDQALVNALTAGATKLNVAMKNANSLGKQVAWAEATIAKSYPTSPPSMPLGHKTLMSNIRVEKMGEPFDSNDPTIGRVQLVRVLPITDNDYDLQLQRSSTGHPVVTSLDNYNVYAVRIADIENGTLQKWYPVPSFRPAAGTLFIPGRFRGRTTLKNYTNPLTKESEVLDGTFSTQTQLGPFIGTKMRISHMREYFLTGGLTFTIGSTSLDSLTLDTPLVKADPTGVQMRRADYLKLFPLTVPVVSWGGAINFDFDGALVGFAFGADRLTNAYSGRWVYNRKMWYAIGIGFQFFKPGSGSN